VRGPGQPGEVGPGFGDGLVPFGRGVLVDEGGSGIGVPHADHDLLGRGARGGQGVPGVVQVVEVQVAYAHGRSCPTPGSGKDPSVEDPSCGPTNSGLSRTGSHVALEVSFDLRHGPPGECRVRSFCFMMKC